MLMKLWKLMIREAKHLLCEGRSHRKEMLPSKLAVYAPIKDRRSWRSIGTWIYPARFHRGSAAEGTRIQVDSFRNTLMKASMD